MTSGSGPETRAGGAIAAALWSKPQLPSEGFPEGSVHQPPFLLFDLLLLRFSWPLFLILALLAFSRLPHLLSLSFLASPFFSRLFFPPTPLRHLSLFSSFCSFFFRVFLFVSCFPCPIFFFLLGFYFLLHSVPGNPCPSLALFVLPPLSLFFFSVFVFRSSPSRLFFFFS